MKQKRGEGKQKILERWVLCKLRTWQPFSAPTFICNNCSNILRCFNNDKNIGLFYKLFVIVSKHYTYYVHSMTIFLEPFCHGFLMLSRQKFIAKSVIMKAVFAMKIFDYFSFLFFLIYHCEDVSLPAFYIFPWLIEVMKTISSFFFTQFCILNN